jgi:hypothetical protein
LAAVEPQFERFMDLSRSLTGREQLDPLVGRLFFDALSESHGSAAVVERLLSDPLVEDVEAAALERRIVEQWYTGVYRSGGAAQRATYQGALMWQAMALRAAPGECQGELGFWSRPP